MLDDPLPEKPFDPLQYPIRLLSAQLVVASTLGLSALLTFCLLRKKYPKLYEARRARRAGLPELSGSFFGWLWSLYKVTDEQVLEHSGLDAFVFLGFFKTSMQLLSILTICAATIISPIRWYYTGRYDQGDEDDFDMARILLARAVGSTPDPDDSREYQTYLWTYVVFTYVFTGLTAFFMIRQSMRVLQVRQKYLGQQNSITDRTIKLSGIPPELRTETALKDYIESLGIGSVRNLHLCRDCKTLDSMFSQRKRLIYKLEQAWAKYLGPTWIRQKEARRNNLLPYAADNQPNPHTQVALDDQVDQVTSTNASLQLGGVTGYDFRRPQERLKFFGLAGPRVDVINHYTNELEWLDSRIELARQRDYAPTDTAFVTMDSVASAQMAAQAVLDPRPHRLLARPAPAPHDIIWRNLYMPYKERMFRSYSIMIAIAILTVIFVFPVSYLASFLNPKAIEKLWPGLYDAIAWDGWFGTFVTGILPPLIFTLLNFAFPYLYWFLSGKQGFLSYGEVELSVISKNFFYVFFNMFFVFTVAGTVSDYWALLRDTTQIAVKLAQSLTRFSLFYVDLIILQGIGMFPFRLLQVGSIVRLPFMLWGVQSARDHRNRYRPPIFNYGIHLPQPILIFIIVMLYSVISSKILFFGAIYFFIGYLVYKYQLLYSWVHPQHSTGRSWVIIMRRVIVGIMLFHLTMTGILVLQKAYFLATMLAPLPVMTFFFWYNFEEDYVPLSYFIALTAIETYGGGTSSAVSLIDEEAQQHNLPPLGPSLRNNSGSGAFRQHRAVSKTLDEARERHQRYVNPNLVRPLEGPWIGVEGDDEIIFADSEGTVRRKVRLEEWE